MEKIIALNGGKAKKKDSGNEDNGHAKLILDGEEYELGAFVLSGESPQGRRLLFTWNSRF